MTTLNRQGRIRPWLAALLLGAVAAGCGGDIETGSQVDEEWLLTVERNLFVELLKTPETQARIKQMLETGKPLRN